jgi:hypothetical protein
VRIVVESRRKAAADRLADLREFIPDHGTLGMPIADTMKPARNGPAGRTVEMDRLAERFVRKPGRDLGLPFLHGESELDDSVHALDDLMDRVDRAEDRVHPFP